MSIFNKALLGKWLWRYTSEPTSLWRRVVDSKHDSQRREWCSNRVRECHGVGLWKHIRAVWDRFSKHITYKVGDGSRIKLWHDIWCGELPLRQKFQDLFHLAQVPDALVADHLHLQGSNFVWDIEFSRPAQDWELEVVDSFMELLYSLVIRPDCMDSLHWTPSRHGIFEVSSFYSVLIQPTPQGYFPWKSVKI